VKSKAFIALLSVVTLLCFLTSCGSQKAALILQSVQPTPQTFASPAAEATPAPTPAVTPEPSPTPTPPPQTVSLLFAGDIMAHKKQVAYHKFGSSYDFTGDYEYIRDIVSAADIALVNLETPMTGKGPYEGYPHFNAPNSLADALLYAGFDIIAAANNHTRDQGNDGIIRTCAYLRSRGLGVIGTDSGNGGTKYALIEKNGIKVGFVNFTVSLNQGFPKSAIPYVNCLRDGEGMENGYLAMEGEIKALKGLGAEFIVVFMHWGSEYQLTGNSTQVRVAEIAADMGADLIIGAHPHVPQNVAEYTSPVTGKNVLIYYSLGNLVSNQPYSYGPGRGYCETGAFALIRLVRPFGGGVSIDAAGYLTTYVLKPNVAHAYTEDGKTHTRTTRAYNIVPAAAVLADPASYEGAEGTLLSHVQRGVENGRRSLGESGAELTHFDFREYTAFEW
jgi:poly-gamma-glutamate synthesis protein (capsule biosynthesis protein)